MSAMYEPAHVAINFQLLEMSSITTRNNLEYSHKVHFQRVFRKNISDFTNLHNEKNQPGSLICVNGIILLLELV